MRRSGQVTLLAVLIGVLGLTIGLSVASRSLSDLRSATNVDIGTKALAAAEAGVEYGLNQINLIGAAAATGAETELADDASKPLGGLTSGIKSVKVKISAPRLNAIVSDGIVEQDDVFQADFSSGSNVIPEVNVGWTGNAEGIEVSFLDSAYNIKRFAYSKSGLLGGSGFESLSGPTLLCNGENGYLSSDINIANPILLRVKPIKGKADKIVVCPSGGSGTFPPQKYVVESTAVTENGTTKKVSVSRDISGKLPGIFDNVLYSGGSIIKN